VACQRDERQYLLKINDLKLGSGHLLNNRVTAYNAKVSDSEHPGARFN
jgi:hypothetical protein